MLVRLSTTELYDYVFEVDQYDESYTLTVCGPMSHRFPREWSETYGSPAIVFGRLAAYLYVAAGGFAEDIVPDEDLFTEHFNNILEAMTE